MSTVTVQNFAEELKRPVAELLAQLKEAGVAADDAKSPLSSTDNSTGPRHSKCVTGAEWPRSSPIWRNDNRHTTSATHSGDVSRGRRNPWNEVKHGHRDAVPTAHGATRRWRSQPQCT